MWRWRLSVRTMATAVITRPYELRLFILSIHTHESHGVKTIRECYENIVKTRNANIYTSSINIETMIFNTKVIRTNPKLYPYR